jgi:hypothetical protein
MASLGLFLSEVVLVSAEQMEETMRYPFLGIMAVVAVFIYSECKEVVRLATPIFTGILPEGAEMDPDSR